MTACGCSRKTCPYGFDQVHDPKHAIHFHIGHDGTRALIRVIRAIAGQIHTTEGKYLNSASPALRIQRDPKFTPPCCRLCEIDEQKSYGVACNCIEHLYSGASCVALIASKL